MLHPPSLGFADAPRYDLPNIELLVFKREVEIHWCSLGLLIEKYFFDMLTEMARDLDSQR
jgi:hypothetical protein